ncbi:MAG: nitroreductase [Verrucomicrobia bacterium]|nr:nitroreductase [Verrucomicrobiota bacterium]
MHASLDHDLSPLAPWEISAEDFPHDGSTVEKWKFLIGYAVLAPSSHNTQPWLFHLHGNDLELYADRTRACRVADPDDRELVMSCGCALFHLRSAMAHFGYFGGVAILPEANDPDLLARVSFGVLEENSPEESMLFYAIPKRRTNRQPFRDDPVPPSLLDALRRAAKDEFAWLHVAEGEETRHAIAELIAEGDRRQWSNKRFRLELAAWVHPNRSTARDGIPGYAQSVDDLLTYAGPLVVRTFNMGEGQAARDHELATGSPALVILGTDTDTPRDWLHAGQALARVLLRAQVENVWGSFLNQTIELPDLRQRLCASVGLTGCPQACLRLGFGEDIKPTPRRTANEVII